MSPELLELSDQLMESIISVIKTETGVKDVREFDSNILDAKEVSFTPPAVFVHEAAGAPFDDPMPNSISAQLGFILLIAVKADRDRPGISKEGKRLMYQLIRLADSQKWGMDSSKNILKSEVTGFQPVGGDAQLAIYSVSFNQPIRARGN